MMSAWAGVTAPYRRSSLRRTARAVGVAAETKARWGADEEGAAIGCVIEGFGCKSRTIAAAMHQDGRDASAVRPIQMMQRAPLRSHSVAILLPPSTGPSLPLKAPCASGLGGQAVQQISCVPWHHAVWKEHLHDRR